MRFNALAAAVLVAGATVAPASHAQDAKLAEPPGEWAVRVAISNTAMTAFAARQFKTLDATAEQFRKTAARTPAGAWSLAQFYGAWNSYPLYGDVKDPRLQTADAWVAASPKSPAAIIVRTIVLEMKAQSNRQLQQASDAAGGAAPVVSDPGAQFVAAEAFLLKHRAVAAQDPHFYAVLMQLQFSRGASEAELMATIDEGLARYPDYFETYVGSIYILADFWKHDKAKIDAYARKLLAATEKRQGHRAYALIYWYLGGTIPPMETFQSFDIDWDVMRQGMDEIVSDFPDPVNSNSFGFLACLHGDKSLTNKMLKIVGQTVNWDLWGPRFYSQCRSWAIPEPAKDAHL